MRLRVQEDRRDRVVTNIACVYRAYELTAFRTGKPPTAEDERQATEASRFRRECFCAGSRQVGEGRSSARPGPRILCGIAVAPRRAASGLQRALRSSPIAHDGPNHVPQRSPSGLRSATPTRPTVPDRRRAGEARARRLRSADPLRACPVALIDRRQLRAHRRTRAAARRSMARHFDVRDQAGDSCIQPLCSRAART